MPKGHTVTEKEVEERLNYLGKYGPTAYAFTLAHRFTAEQAWGSVQVARLDHLVVTVQDVDASCAFYESVLGMRIVTFGAGRKAVALGNQKINLHAVGRALEPKGQRRAHGREPGPAPAPQRAGGAGAVRASEHGKNDGP
jgi:hypothetical protein